MTLAFQVLLIVLVPVVAIAFIARCINRSAAANAEPGGTDQRA
jgi:hypothetical protein